MSDALKINDCPPGSFTSSLRPVGYREMTQESSPRRSSTRSSKKEKRPKVPNVMRSSVVQPDMEILPPFSSLASDETIHQKLARVIEKFNIDLAEELTPPPERKLTNKQPQ
ncbi:hypothetical protein J6590_056445 [Homalodisca vitripennis]|nr:hypothetical protein J6590_056445 [Homalodisca vitripennis]